MSDFELMQVRDLHGEDLDRLAPDSPGVLIRFLAEVGEMIATRGDGDVLAVGCAGEVRAAAAAGYGLSVDDVRVVTARRPHDHEALRLLLTDIEARTLRRRCPTLVCAVDVGDGVARRTFERLGYAVTGAGVAVWSERTGPGDPDRVVDTWTMRKEVARRGAAPAADDPVVDPSRVPPEEDEFPGDVRIAD